MEMYPPMYKSHWDVRTEGYHSTCKYYTLSTETLKVSMLGYLGSLTTKITLNFAQIIPVSQ